MKNKLVSDKYLLISSYLKNPDESTFNQIVKEFTPMIFSVCYRVLQKRDLAEEAVQATFLALIDKRNKLKEGPRMIGWLHRVAYLSSLWLRKQENVRKLNEEKTMKSTIKETPEQIFEKEELNSFIDEAIHSLPEKYKDVIFMRFYEEKSCTEIGQYFNLKEGNVRKRIERGLEKVKYLLKKRNVIVTSSAIGFFLGKKLIQPTSFLGSHTENLGSTLLMTQKDTTANGYIILKGTEKMIILAKIQTLGIALTIALIIGTTSMMIVSGNDQPSDKKEPVKNIVNLDIGQPENLTEVEYNKPKNQKYGSRITGNHYLKMIKIFDEDRIKFYRFWAKKAIDSASANNNIKNYLANHIKVYYDTTKTDIQTLNKALKEERKQLYAGNKINYKDKEALKAIYLKSKLIYEKYANKIKQAKSKNTKEFNSKVLTLFGKEKGDLVILWLVNHNIMSQQWARKFIKKEGKVFHILSYHYHIPKHSYPPIKKNTTYKESKEATSIPNQ